MHLLLFKIFTYHISVREETKQNMADNLFSIQLKQVYMSGKLGTKTKYKNAVIDTNPYICAFRTKDIYSP